MPTARSRSRSTARRETARRARPPSPPVDPGLEACVGSRGAKAAERQLADDRRLLAQGYFFDAAAADNACVFIEGFCRHSKDRFAGKPFVMEPWQRRIVRRIFGWMRPGGVRRYSRAHIWIPKKNGKSTWAAAIGLHLLINDRTSGAEVFCLASAEHQARLVFDEARRMAEASDELATVAAVYTDSIFMQSTMSKMAVLSAKISSQHGINPSALIIDELHAVEDRELYDVATGGSMIARRQPIEIVISTAGYDRHSVAWEQWRYAEQVLDGVFDDPHFLGVIYAADPQDDWKDEATWFKANPNLGVSIELEKFREEFNKALKSPAAENIFKRMNLNLWTEQAVRYLQVEVWDTCAQPVVPDDELVGRPCYAGLDLSQSRDLTAFVRVFPRADLAGEKEDGSPRLVVSYDVRCRFWIPGEVAAEKEREDRVPYRRWIDDGLVTVTEGNMIDYDAIYRDVSDEAAKSPIIELAYDRMFMAQLVNQLMSDGLTVVPFHQGYSGMAKPVAELPALIASKRLRHGGHPVLRWCASNLAVKQNAGGQLMPAKNKSTGRIDGVVAMLMALGRAIMRDGDGKSVYESRGIISL